MNADRILSAAGRIQVAAHELASGYKELGEELDACRREVMAKGGQHSVEDLIAWAGPDRLRTDIVALLVSVGLGDILVHAQGRQDQRPAPEFFQRYESLVNSDVLTATRGKAPTDPLAAYDAPGVKRVRTVEATSPQGRPI